MVPGQGFVNALVEARRGRLHAPQEGLPAIMCRAKARRDSAAGSFGSLGAHFVQLFRRQVEGAEIG